MANVIEIMPAIRLLSFCHQARTSASEALCGTLTLATVTKKQMAKRTAAAAAIRRAGCTLGPGRMRVSWVVLLQVGTG